MMANSSYRFEARINGGNVPYQVVRKRAYGSIRIEARWARDFTARERTAEVKVSGDLEPRDALGYAELFFHDLFLLLNLAEPGSFSGRVSISGGEREVSELTFYDYLFHGIQETEPLPLAKVVAWYDGLGIGTRQLATNGVTMALFQLLRLARVEEDEEVSLLRLASAAEALGVVVSLPGPAPVIHPLFNDSLDPRIEDLTMEWIDAADAAARAVVGELQRLAMQ